MRKQLADMKPQCPPKGPQFIGLVAEKHLVCIPRQAVRANGVRAFDHDGAARFALRQQALRFVELTLERRSGALPTVLNGGFSKWDSDIFVDGKGKP